MSQNIFHDTIEQLITRHTEWKNNNSSKCKSNKFTSPRENLLWFSEKKIFQNLAWYSKFKTQPLHNIELNCTIRFNV